LVGIDHISQKQGARLRGRRLQPEELDVLTANVGPHVDDVAFVGGNDHQRIAVASDCGFASVDQMRCAFQRKLGITPVRYRESFQVSATGDRVEHAHG
jgi:AraC-like DNA-binding protein